MKSIIICLGVALLTVVIGSPVNLTGSQAIIPAEHRDITHNSSILQSVCRNMTPTHGSQLPQDTPAPYVINVSKNSASPGEEIQITLIGKDSTEFRGVYVQGRNGEVPVGEFRPSEPNTPKTTLTDCDPGTKNVASYISRVPITQLVLTYVVPQNVPSIVFRATYVKDRTTYWLGIISETVSIS